MKWKLRNALIVAVILTGASASYAGHAIVLAGLDTAKHYQGNTNHKKIYVRVGSFSHETNAMNVRNALRSRLHYPVKMAYNHGYYTVTVGPLASAETARQVGETIPADLQMPAKKSSHKAVKPAPVKAARKQSAADTAKNTVPAVKTPVTTTAPTAKTPAANTAVTTPAAQTPAVKTPAATAAAPIVSVAPAVSAKPAAATTSKKQNKITAAKPASPVEPAAAPSTTSAMYDRFFKSFQNNSTQANWSSSVYLSGSVGDSFNRTEGTNVLATGAGWPDDDYVTKGITDQPFFSLGGGYIWSRDNDLLPYYSLGMKLIYVSTSTITGYIDQYSLPEFRNYNFQYDVQLLNIMASAKADLYRWKNLMPYVMGAIGLTNFSTSEYIETPTGGVTPRVSPGFGSGSGNNFSYSVGVGIDYAFMQNLWLNAEFNYTDYGTVGTDNGQNYATLTGTNYDDEALKHTVAATSLSVGLTYFVG